MFVLMRTAAKYLSLIDTTEQTIILLVDENKNKMQI